MLNDLQKMTLKKANDNLKLLFPTMKIRSITMRDIEKVYARSVLSITADSKTRKGEKRGYLTGIMYLAPSNISGLELCPKKSKGCASACLFSAGRGAFASVTKQRIIKTLAYHFDRPRFIATIKRSIKSLETKARNKDMIPVVRLNGTSDIPWELTTDIIQSYSTIQFYDYTKIDKRFQFTLPSNYHLTFSMSEANENAALQVLIRRHNVAVVYRDYMPDVVTFSDTHFPVINGDNDDLRFLDQGNGVIVGLRAKGKAKKDTTGFVKDIKPLKLAA